MIICVDFDGCVVRQAAFNASWAELELVHGAKDALIAMRNAGHILVLYSSRANRALRVDPSLNPLVRDGIIRVDRERWAKEESTYQQRYETMLEFIADQLPGVFHAIDDGSQGKPDADLFLEGLGRTMDTHGSAWRRVMHAYGEPEEHDDGGTDPQEETVRRKSNR